MTFRTEDELLSATNTDDTDKRMQRALKIRKEIRALASDAIRRDDEECASAMEQLHFLNGVALLGLHAKKPYDFIDFELAAQPEDPGENPDVFRLLPVLVNEPDDDELEDILGQCEEGLAAWRKEVPPVVVN
jgi:hypothetical protein